MRGRTSAILPVYFSPSAPSREAIDGQDTDDAKLGSSQKTGSSLRLLFTRLVLGRAVGRRRVQRAQRAAFVIALSLIALALLLLRWTLRVDSRSMTPVLLTPSAANAKASKASRPVRQAYLPSLLRSFSARPAASVCVQLQVELERGCLRRTAPQTAPHILSSAHPLMRSTSFARRAASQDELAMLMGSQSQPVSTCAPGWLAQLLGRSRPLPRQRG